MLNETYFLPVFFVAAFFTGATFFAVLEVAAGLPADFFVAVGAAVFFATAIMAPSFS